jgi:hypothetical protein
MPRVKKYFERMLTWLPEGTFDRMDTVLRPTEDRASFVRTVVERELRRREQQAPAAKPSPTRRRKAAA